MKGIRVLVNVVLAVIVSVNIFSLGLTFIYGGITRGVYYAVLTDRPEFSHLGDALLLTINIVSTVLVILGTVLPILFLFIPKGTIKDRQALIACLSLIPISFLLVRLSFFPDPDSFSQSSKGGYQLRTYVWTTSKGKVVKKWISEKPYSAYKHQERVKWILVEETQGE